MSEGRRGLAPPVSALLVLALIFAAFWFRGDLLEPDPVRDTPERGAFNTASAIDRLTRVLDGAPHPVDSDALDATRERLLAEIRTLGYSPTVHDETACMGNKSGALVRCARVRNITFAAGPPAHDAGTPVTLLTAHYDSVDASPGFGDDGVGVAVWLEIADIFRDAPPAGPVLFLLTDGEETALLGAKAFTDANAYGRTIGAIVNLEARGVRGPAIMFETSTPNADVVLPWSRNGARPASNSMTASVYRYMPNSTDLTVHLGAGRKGVNIAIGDGLSFYHTSRDDLAELDPRSVQHMGDQALGAARAFAAGGAPEAGDVVYSDIAGRIFVLLSQPLALGLLIVFVLLAAALIVRPARETNPRGFSWTSFALPLLVLVTSTGAAFALQALLGALRPEPAFWTAHPQAFNAAIFLAALLVAVLGVSYVAPRATRAELFASGWFWFLAAGLGLSILVPGASMLFVIPGVVFALAATASFLWPSASLPAWTVAGATVLVVFLPILYLLDVMMGLSLAPAFGGVEALVLSPLLCLIGPLPRGRVPVLATLAAGMIAAIAVAASLPAYSRASPMPLNYTARIDPGAGKADLAASQPLGALPTTLRSGFKTLPDLFLGQKDATATLRDAPYSAHPAATASVDASTGVPVLRLSAPGARLVRLRIPPSANATSVSVNGSAPLAIDASSGVTQIDCVGRACDGAVLAFNAEALQPKADASDWMILGYWSGLPADIAPLAPARPETAVPIQMGDMTVVKTLFKPQ